MRFVNCFLLFVIFVVPTPLIAGDFASQAARIDAQMKVSDRHKFDIPRDEHRKPVEVLRFFKLESGMTVMDVAAYAGYTTEMLAAAVGPKGKVYSQNREIVLSTYADGYYARTMTERLANQRLPNVVLHLSEYEDIGLENELDFAFMGNILHDFYYRDGEANALLFLGSIKKALKPGGVLGVTDHIGIATADNASLHRIELLKARDLLVRAGFIIEAESQLLANDQDDHKIQVYDKSIYLRTDRLLFRARKPLSVE